MISNEQGDLDNASWNFAYELSLRIVGLNELTEGALDGIMDDIQKEVNELELKSKNKYKKIVKESNESKN